MTTNQEKMSLKEERCWEYVGIGWQENVTHKNLHIQRINKYIYLENWKNAILQYVYKCSPKITSWLNKINKGYRYKIMKLIAKTSTLV